ncbi:MAG TPA: ATP-binding cassette domain-containing protein, partial [Thermopetrobacter sp.]|nr:ATP-binding cassette domain-containing protein [Thermopetrobacter sp.]
RVEIVRCLLSDPRIIILDEPTSVLTPQEARELFATLRKLAGEGRAILYISHRLEEVRELCDAATVLRHGRVVAGVDPRRETAASLARLMVGAEIHAVKAAPPPEEPGPPLLHVRDLTLPAEGPFGVALYGISLDVRGGEVLAIAGVAGNGQRELFRALSGERPAQGHGVVFIAGEDVSLAGINARRRAGAAFVPEERLGHACVPQMTLAENVVLTRHAADARLVRHGFIDRRAARAAAAEIIEVHDVRGGAPEVAAAALSGGNLQKFIMGRELETRPRVMVVNQPTWGVDAGAAAVIRQRLVDLARGGAAVLVISQDLDEIFEIADRIAVISRGELSPARPAAELDRERVGLLMAGAHERRHARAAEGAS